MSDEEAAEAWERYYDKRNRCRSAFIAGYLAGLSAARKDRADNKTLCQAEGTNGD